MNHTLLLPEMAGSKVNCKLVEGVRNVIGLIDVSTENRIEFVGYGSNSVVAAVVVGLNKPIDRPAR